MPVDNSRPAPTRRPSRKITEEELKDIEQKRIRGELSCAECRRLKLRCDKKVPCSSCVRRGCDSICPCGILSAGQGTRFILADTDQLHRKIAEMSQRIRQLEDGMAILQSSVSHERHPLLEDNLLKIKFGSEALNPAQHATEADPATQESIDAFGTLTLSSEGEMKYFGRSAGTETLMVAGEEWDSGSNHSDDVAEEGTFQQSLPEHINTLANLFPFTRPSSSTDAASPSAESSLETIESFLPPQDRAWTLCQSYIDHAALFFRPIKRDELLEEFVPTVYNAASARSPGGGASPNSNPDSIGSSSSAGGSTATPHSLSALFFIFALGALFDLNLSPYNSEAEHYFALGRAALSLRPVLDSPGISTVRAVGLMATYCSHAGKKYTRDSAWCAMSLAAKLAQSIGLHRDPSRWNMDPTTVQRRRALWWEVLAGDISHSLALGRPPSVSLSLSDCEFPIDEEATMNEKGDIQYGFWRMKHTFARDIFMPTVESTLVAKSPSYSAILDLDKKVREIPFPDSFKPYVRLEEGEEQFYSSSLSLRDFYAAQHRPVVMQYLHRSFFAQALLDHPKNPLLSPFAPSFLTAYRCASIIIKAAAHHFERCSKMAVRVWFLMYHVFSAAVIVGTVVTRSPNCNIASSALLDLSLAVELFQKSAPHSQRAKTALVVLRKLKDKAMRSYSQFCSASLPSMLRSPELESDRNSFELNQSSAKCGDADDELSIFGGQTRVLTRRRIKRNAGSATSFGSADSSPSPPADAASPAGSAGSPGPSDGQSQWSPALTNMRINTAATTNQGITSMGLGDVHPSLIGFLNGAGATRNGDFTEIHASIPAPVSFLPALPSRSISQPQLAPSSPVHMQPPALPRQQSRPRARSSISEPVVPSYFQPPGRMYGDGMEFLGPNNDFSAGDAPSWSGPMPQANGNALPRNYPQQHRQQQAAQASSNSFGWMPELGALSEELMQPQQPAPMGFSNPFEPFSGQPTGNTFGFGTNSKLDPRAFDLGLIPDGLATPAADLDVDVGGWASFMRECGIVEAPMPVSMRDMQMGR